MGFTLNYKNGASAISGLEVKLKPSNQGAVFIGLRFQFRCVREVQGVVESAEKYSLLLCQKNGKNVII